MLTDIDIQKIIKANKEIFTTKDDLKEFATKDDLKKFATKDDLKEFATKDDLKEFATKDDLDKTSTLLIKEIFTTKDKISKRLDDVDEKFNNLHTAIDSYAQKSDSYFQEMVMLSHKVNRQEKWIQEIANKVGVRLEY